MHLGFLNERSFWVIFSLVHSDIWGPSRVSSTLAFSYFVSFIDDYSICTWVFLMKDRSELFSIFKSFFAEIQNQFGVSICTFHSDNALEYLSSQFWEFMTHQGLIHQTTCPPNYLSIHPSTKRCRWNKKSASYWDRSYFSPWIQCSTAFFGRCSFYVLLFINRMPSSFIQIRFHIPYCFFSHISIISSLVSLGAHALFII